MWASSMHCNHLIKMVGPAYPHIAVGTMYQEHQQPCNRLRHQNCESAASPMTVLSIFFVCFYHIRSPLTNQSDPESPQGTRSDYAKRQRENVLNVQAPTAKKTAFDSPPKSIVTTDAAPRKPFPDSESARANDPYDSYVRRRPRHWNPIEVTCMFPFV